MSSTIKKLIVALEELKTARPTIKLVKEMHSSCQVHWNESNRLPSLFNVCFRASRMRKCRNYTDAFRWIRIITSRILFHRSATNGEQVTDSMFNSRANRRSLLVNSNTSTMIVACDKLLKPALCQLDCLNVDVKVETYERIISSFTEAWTTALRERKYRFS